MVLLKSDAQEIIESPILLKNIDEWILNDTDIADFATTSYVDTKVASIVDSAPETLDTLNELALALGDDPNFATTVATEIGKKANQTDLDKTNENVSAIIAQIGNIKIVISNTTPDTSTDLTNTLTVVVPEYTG